MGAVRVVVSGVEPSVELDPQRVAQLAQPCAAARAAQCAALGRAAGEAWERALARGAGAPREARGDARGVILSARTDAGC